MSSIPENNLINDIFPKEVIAEIQAISTYNSEQNDFLVKDGRVTVNTRGWLSLLRTSPRGTVAARMQELLNIVEERLTVLIPDLKTPNYRFDRSSFADLAAKITPGLTKGIQTIPLVSSRPLPFCIGERTKRFLLFDQTDGQEITNTVVRVTNATSSRITIEFSSDGVTEFTQDLPPGGVDSRLLTPKVNTPHTLKVTKCFQFLHPKFEKGYAYTLTFRRDDQLLLQKSPLSNATDPTTLSVCNESDKGHQVLFPEGSNPKTIRVNGSIDYSFGLAELPENSLQISTTQCFSWNTEIKNGCHEFIFTEQNKLEETRYLIDWYRRWPMAQNIDFSERRDLSFIAGEYHCLESTFTDWHESASHATTSFVNDGDKLVRYDYEISPKVDITNQERLNRRHGSIVVHPKCSTSLSNASFLDGLPFDPSPKSDDHAYNFTLIDVVGLHGRVIGQ